MVIKNSTRYLQLRNTLASGEVLLNADFEVDGQFLPAVGQYTLNTQAVLGVDVIGKITYSEDSGWSYPTEWLDFTFASGIEVWVDSNNGLDTNDGTQASPYKTLARAVTDTPDVIRLREGNYVGRTLPATKDLCLVGGPGVYIEGTQTRFESTNGSSIYCYNIVFRNSSLKGFFLVGASGTTTGYFVNCEFVGNTTDGFTADRGAQAYLINCRAYENSGDGFDYHDTGTFFLEYACTGHTNGDAGANGDNGSTSHTGCKGIRINCQYFNNRGG